MGQLHRLLAALVLATALGIACGQASTTVRGINPELGRFYANTNGQFRCLDGSKTIPYDRVNDDYCDCGDGTDEPGTSACPNGRFFCRNRGHEPKLLSASFVDDGVCDCCDGSDEPVGCPNRCLEAGEEQRAAKRAKASLMTDALQKKAEFVATARAKRESWASRTQAVGNELEMHRAWVTSLREQKIKAEDAHRAAVQQQAETARAEAEAQHAASVAAEAAAAAAAHENAAVLEQQQQEGEPAPVGAHGDQAQQEESAEELGRRIASQWTHDPEAAGVPAPAHEAEGELEGDGSAHEHEEVLDQEHDFQHPDSYDESHHDQYEDHHDHHHQYHAPPSVPEPEELRALRQKLELAEQSLAALESEQRLISRLGPDLGRWDFGPDDVFLPLAERCITAAETRWTYDACFYDKAVQREGHSNQVSVGVWYGFDNNYSEAVFAGGDFCGAINAPRTFRVFLHCAHYERLYNAQEPSTCAYTAHLDTPLACTADDLEAVSNELAALEALEAEIRAEIAAAAAGAPAALGAAKDEL